MLIPVAEEQPDATISTQYNGILSINDTSEEVYAPIFTTPSPSLKPRCQIATLVQFDVPPHNSSHCTLSFTVAPKPLFPAFMLTAPSPSVTVNIYSLESAIEDADAVTWNDKPKQGGYVGAFVFRTAGKDVLVGEAYPDCVSGDGGTAGFVLRIVPEGGYRVVTFFGEQARRFLEGSVASGLTTWQS